MDENNFEYLPSNAGITFWVKTNIADTHSWVNKKAIPKYNLVVVPGSFFYYKNNYKLVKTNTIRLGIGNINPGKPNLIDALETFKKSINS